MTYELLGYGAIAGTGSSLDPDAFGYPTVSGNYAAAYNIAVADIVGMVTSATQYYNNTYSNGQLSALPPDQWVNHHYLTNEFEYYGQDSWKMRPNLTVTFGLRHTLLQVPYERNGQEVVPTVNMGQWLDARWHGASAGQVVQPTFGFIQGGRANSKPGFWNMDKLDLAPALCDRLSADTQSIAVHAGFGLYYDHFGQGIVDSFDQAGEFGLVTSDQAPVGAADADTAPRFSTETAVPTSIIPSIRVTGPTPVIPGDDLALAWGADQSITSPYSYAFNFGIQTQLRKGLTMEETYTGRLGRHMLQMRDVATPSNLADPQSGTDYFTAERQLDQLNDASTPINSVAPIPYWEEYVPLDGRRRLFGNAEYLQPLLRQHPGPRCRIPRQRILCALRSRHCTGCVAEPTSSSATSTLSTRRSMSGPRWEPAAITVCRLHCISSRNTAAVRCLLHLRQVARSRL